MVTGISKDCSAFLMVKLCCYFTTKMKAACTFIVSVTTNQRNITSKETYS